jgi:tripartite-type tricarboxylate transporter receptor subunit TctC
MKHMTNREKRSMSNTHRVAVRMALAMATLALAPAMASAQSYPAKPVRVISAYAPGGPNDVVARPVVEQLSRTMGQQFILENRPGANGNIGAAEVAKAPADGYTLLFGTTSQLTINPALYNMPFDSIRDFAPIILCSQIPGALVVSTGSPYNSVKDVIAAARANPGKLTYSSAGNGSQNHLGGELFAMLTQTRLVHVPYKGGGPALTGVLSGEVSMIFQSPSLGLSQIRAGKLKALMVSSPRRMAILPDTPTNDEAGLPEFKSRAGTGFLAPARTPRPIIDRLNAEIGRYLNSPEGQKYFAGQGVDLYPGTPEDFARVLQDELARWTAVVKTAGIKLE